ncbi:MAG: exosortase O [Elainellaceae cyanobacterium]
MTHNSPSAQVDAHLKHSGALHGPMVSAIALLWLYIASPELGGLVRLLPALSPFNLALMGGAAAALLIQSIRHRRNWGFSGPTFRPLPLMMLGGAAIALVLARWRLDLEQLSIVGFVVGTYGFAGLFCRVRAWRRGIPFMGTFALLILLLLLEFTDLGHLARTSIAEVVEVLLRPLSIPAISSEDILVLSTGVALVDIPCSGFKGIEIGSLLFMAASLIERKQLGLRWFLVGLTNVTLLITANVARILVLVILTFVLQQQTLAEILHVPLGIFGFITVCLITLQLLRAVPRQPLPILGRQLDEALTAAPPQRNAALTLSLLAGLALISHPAASTASPAQFDALRWSEPMQAQVIDLSPYEQTFFTRYPDAVAQKQAFQFNNISGSMILVASPTWQAHHAPETCYAASGLQIDQMQKQAFTHEVTGRWLSLNQGQRRAAYWFQSSQHTTDYYLDRVWREITRQDPNWTMVSILFDQPLSASDVEVRAIVDQVHGAIALAMR